MKNNNIQLDIQMSIESDPPVLPMILEGLIEGSVGAIIAPGSTGKSMFALELTTFIASLGQSNLLGFKLPENSPCWSESEILRGRCAYVTAEDSLEILQRRIHFIGQSINLDARKNLYENLMIISLYGYSPYLLGKEGRDSRWIQFLLNICEMNKIVFLDTLSLFHDLEENNSGDMKNLVNLLKEIAYQTKCSIVFLHHVNKSSMLSGNGDEQAASRGSSVLVDNIRWQINLSCMDKKEANDFGIKEDQRKQYVKISGSKMNYGALGGDLWLRRDLEQEGVLKSVRLSPKTDRRAGGERRGDAVPSC